MKPIKFLEPEIAEQIEEITSRFSDVTPIDKLIHLTKFINSESDCIYSNGEYYHVSSITSNIIKDIIKNHPEQLLLHFATYDPKNTSHAAFVTPISENFDCITYIRKNHTPNPTPVASAIAVASVLKRKDSDIEFDLTLVDTYQLNSDKSKEPYIKSYLYGNPYDEDWEYVQKTNFSDIADVIENNKLGKIDATN